MLKTAGFYAEPSSRAKALMSEERDEDVCSALATFAEAWDELARKASETPDPGRAESLASA